MAGWRNFHKTQTEKATKFGIVGAKAVRVVYVAPHPTRHLPTECRPGWGCDERGADRVRLGRRHLLARPPRGLRTRPQSVVAQLLPSIPVGHGDGPVATFERATNNIPVVANEFIVGMSDVRRVHIEDTGVVALERTRCTQTLGGVRVVTLFWAIYVAPEHALRMARICAEGEAELRAYRSQVADFLRRWTTSAAVAIEESTIIFR